MPFRCCVPKCRGNYDNGPKVSVFGFPKDTNLKQKWIAAIHRQNFQSTDNSKVITVKPFVISSCFGIMNVGQVFKGKHNLNAYQEPLTASESDMKVAFLNNFIDWLENWEKCKPSSGFFSKETLYALKHTSYTTLEIARYCCQELGMKYILTAKLQTDALEDRFDRYTQLAGSRKPHFRRTALRVRNEAAHLKLSAPNAELLRARKTAGLSN
ncbi:hypothetical protein PR048_014847 [Dryococelus australis]|uniref:THAP-type domain-containing protein n=1 Tax=Dryococelus australis TaxID=614101 RepID=A0ABQ9HFB7_9NEOP|nr:hypothetical protein PR048_014847 [Dryococelus australis]